MDSVSEGAQPCDFVLANDSAPSNDLERRQWWTELIGAYRDPNASWRWSEIERREDGSNGCWLELTSYGSELRCLLMEPERPRTQSAPANATDHVVIIPFYDVGAVVGDVTDRNSDQSDAERERRAFAKQLVDGGSSVLIVPWWCEVEAHASGETHLGLAERYTRPAQCHAKRHPISAYGRAVADLMSAVDALVETPRFTVAGTGIGVFGHSLGGKLALALAALDTRITAVVMHEPGLGFDYSNWEEPWYFGDRLPNDRDLDDLMALIAPRPCLYVGGDAFDGAMNEALATSARSKTTRHGKWLELMRHDAGHTPPLHVLDACYSWLRTKCTVEDIERADQAKENQAEGLV